MLLHFLNKIKFFLLIFILVLLLIFILSKGKVYEKDELSYGVTFSQKHAESLELDWQQLYLDILKDLQVKRLRIPAYWDEVEKVQGEYNFDDLDWQINLALEHNAQIILAVGARLPRWPECHIPDWANDLAITSRNAKILDYIKETVNRYQDYDNISAWQIENEFFLAGFGECPKFKTKFLDEEIALVKKLSPDKPIIITDSGELSLWVPAASRADIFGTSLYLNTYSSLLENYIRYPIRPGFFIFKKNLTKIFAKPEEWIVIELQAEPWGPVPYQYLPQHEKVRTMDLQKFKDIIEFSRLAGFQKFYLWGVEWWYWEKTVNDKPQLWDEAKKLFIK